ncbi:MAG: 50S ribosomal protein L24 [Clostridia bacterium]|nr:50S ribosomal protein L24 [Clostridia bacterium]
MKMHVKTGDTVVVLSGDDRKMQDNSGKLTPRVGKVIAASPEEGKVIVEGVNVVSKHKKARKQGETSSIVKTEAAVYASKVQLYCPKCKRGVRTKAGTKEANGKTVKTRLCCKCGTEI